jgi:hypothetical protein
MDASRPVALILQKRVVPPAEIAFCMDGEIQIKGPTSADETIRIMIDTDLGEIDEAYRGLTFRQWATASGVPIVNDVA